MTGEVHTAVIKALLERRDHVRYATQFQLKFNTDLPFEYRLHHEGGLELAFARQILTEGLKQTVDDDAAIISIWPQIRHNRLFIRRRQVVIRVSNLFRLVITGRQRARLRQFSQLTNQLVPASEEDHAYSDIANTGTDNLERWLAQQTDH